MPAFKHFTTGIFKLCISVVLLSAFRVVAVNFIVTHTNDTVKVTSLRGAIIAANRLGGKNTIILGRGRHEHADRQRQWVYHLTIAGVDEDDARTGDLDIKRGSLHIIGASSSVVIDATDLGDRVFQVFSNANLTLEHLVIKGGIAPSGSGLFAEGEFGGGIFNAGTLILKHCVITNNTSGIGNHIEGNAGGTGGGDGGGIYNSGTLFANDCAIIGNHSGSGVDGASGGSGGGIRSDGFCRLTDCTISGNESAAGAGPAGNAIGIGGSGGNGGGIFNVGTMILTGCIVGKNVAGSGAGGGEPSGIVTIGSPGGPGGHGGNGGGIYNIGKLKINFCAIYRNDGGRGGDGGTFGAGGYAGAGGNGGGVYNTGRLWLNTSTISGNVCGDGANGGSGSFGGAANGGSGGSGGGVYNAGSLTLTSSTITLNHCGAGGAGGSGSISFNPVPPSSGGKGGSGGGILNVGDVACVVARNTLIAKNSVNIGGAAGTNIIRPFMIIVGQQPTNQIQIGDRGSSGKGLDLAGNFVSQQFNLIGTADGSAGFTNGIDDDQVGSDANPMDPHLGPLQMNGGVTPTHALLWGSPAIDQGNSFGMHRDQRGRHRPHRYPFIHKPAGGDGSDIGAFELDPNHFPPGRRIYRVRTGKPRFGPHSKGFGFTVSGASNLVIVVEACTNLINPDWIPIQTNTLSSGSLDVDDLHWTNFQSRYYRVLPR